jgi:xanthine dehydrogenase molybdopterin-binding subunit B
MHKVEVDVRRLGGGFGGKEDQATPFAVLASLGAYISKKTSQVGFTPRRRSKNDGQKTSLFF